MDADEMMGRVSEHTHYFPESWREECASHAVRDEFLSIFKFKAQVFAEEVLVVLLAPYMLCKTLPEHSDRILAFIQQHTVNVEGLGGVCAFSLFDFKRYGDERYAAPSEGEGTGGQIKIDRTEQGKLEKSFLNFKMNHPDWKCGPEGDAFMQNLCDFQVSTDTLTFCGDTCYLFLLSLRRNVRWPRVANNKLPHCWLHNYTFLKCFNPPCSDSRNIYSNHPHTRHTNKLNPNNSIISNHNNHSNMSKPFLA